MISPESLRIIASANAELSSLISQASVKNSRGADRLPVIDAQLPAIAATIEKAGHAIASFAFSGDLDQETRIQIDLYIQNLQRLKTLLAQRLAAAQARRRHLAGCTLRTRQAQSWLGTLELTKID